MPRGGARLGAGRPRKCPERKAERLTKAEVKVAAAARGQTPLEFMLAVMNDLSEDMKLRAQMAQAAAPYVHAKPGEEKKGKKEEAQEKANAIGRRFAPIGPPKLAVVKPG